MSIPSATRFFARLAICLLVSGLCAIATISGVLSSVHARGVFAPTPTASASGQFKPVAEPKIGKFDPASIANIDLKAYPIVPEVSNYVSVIYQEGRRLGNNPSVFSKVGDCMTATEDFMAPFAKGDYNLDQYASLQAVIERFLGAPARTPDSGFDSFSNPGLAAASGFNAASVLDSTWSDPKWCGGDESPLSCEYRISKPSFAFIMFGTNDIKSVTPEQFEYYLRSVVVQTINVGVVPILSTFPNQPNQIDASVLYNKITVKVAQEYKIPLINLWLAFDPLPHQGVDPTNTTHMTKPDSGKTASFAKIDLTAGYNVRNLLSLQTLEAVLKVVDPGSLKKAN